MRDLEETLSDLRTLQGKRMDVGFYRGRVYQHKSRAPSGDAEAWEATAATAQEVSDAAVKRLKDDLAEMHRLITELGGDLL